MRPGSAESQLWDSYAGRIRWPLALLELDLRHKANAPAEARMATEAEAIRAQAEKADTLCLMDEGGDDLTSEALATWIDDLRTNGRPHLCFAIGGADGLDPRLKREAQRRLSFGRVTWPHLLVRGLLAEQLYRAQQILAGHPYHRR